MRAVRCIPIDYNGQKISTTHVSQSHNKPPTVQRRRHSSVLPVNTTNAVRRRP